jgi:hypothetical protein
MTAPTCCRCQRTATEIPQQYDEPCKLWKITWNHSTEEEILCSECLDLRDSWIQQQTGHIINYEAPEGIILGEPCPNCDNLITHEEFNGVCEECFQDKK